jgi:hypothetical protein
VHYHYGFAGGGVQKNYFSDVGSFLWNLPGSSGVLLLTELTASMIILVGDVLHCSGVSRRAKS